MYTVPWFGLAGSRSTAMSGKPPTHGGVERSTRSVDHVSPSSSLNVVDRLNEPAPQPGDVMFAQ